MAAAHPLLQQVGRHQPQPPATAMFLLNNQQIPPQHAGPEPSPPDLFPTNLSCSNRPQDDGVGVGFGRGGVRGHPSRQRCPPPRFLPPPGRRSGVRTRGEAPGGGKVPQIAPRYGAGRRWFRSAATFLSAAHESDNPVAMLRAECRTYLLNDVGNTGGWRDQGAPSRAPRLKAMRSRRGLSPASGTRRPHLLPGGRRRLPTR